MPELPGVALQLRYLNVTAQHPVAHVHVCDPSLLIGTTPQALDRALGGGSLERTRRHVKYLLVETQEGPWLVLAPSA